MAPSTLSVTHSLIELLLDDEEGVLESAVVGVPHPDLAKLLWAFLLPKTEQS